MNTSNIISIITIVVSVITWGILFFLLYKKSKVSKVNKVPDWAEKAFNEEPSDESLNEILSNITIKQDTKKKNKSETDNNPEEFKLKWDSVCFGYTYENNFGLAPNFRMNKRLLEENSIGEKFKTIFPNLTVFQKPEVCEEALPKYYIIFSCYSTVKKSDSDYTYMELLALSDDLDFEKKFKEIEKAITKEYWLENCEPAYF